MKRRRKRLLLVSPRAMRRMWRADKEPKEPRLNQRFYQMMPIWRATAIAERSFVTATGVNTTCDGCGRELSTWAQGSIRVASYVRQAENLWQTENAWVCLERGRPRRQCFDKLEAAGFTMDRAHIALITTLAGMGET